jgi:hypothetical protein
MPGDLRGSLENVVMPRLGGGAETYLLARVCGSKEA